MVSVVCCLFYFLTPSGCYTYAAVGLSLNKFRRHTYTHAEPSHDLPKDALRRELRREFGDRAEAEWEFIHLTGHPDPGERMEARHAVGIRILGLFLPSGRASGTTETRHDRKFPSGVMIHTSWTECRRPKGAQEVPSSTPLSPGAFNRSPGPPSFPFSCLVLGPFCVLRHDGLRAWAPSLQLQEVFPSQTVSKNNSKKPSNGAIIN